MEDMPGRYNAPRGPSDDLARRGQPCLVLTNDDGVESSATQSLAKRLHERTKLPIVVCCPHVNRSGSSMSLTLRSDLKLAHRPDLGNLVFALHGTPADAVVVALDSFNGILCHLGLAPKLLVSGPNYGYNVSGDVAHSGTVGAAKQAGYMGVPAIASSFRMISPEDECMAVSATVQLVEACIANLGEGIARYWPRDPANPRSGLLKVSTEGLLDPSGTLQMQGEGSLAQSETLRNAFAAGDLLLNLNVPPGWKPEHRFRTTSLSAVVYREVMVTQYGTRGNGRQNTQLALKGPQLELQSPPVDTTVDLRQNIGCKEVRTNGEEIASQVRHENVGKRNLCENLMVPTTYANRAGRRIFWTEEGQDLHAVKSGAASITCLQTWPDGHPWTVPWWAMRHAIEETKGLGLPQWLVVETLAENGSMQS